ncbi:MAG: hypothetical protein KatS3mg051_1025 [Anaerolineae bacterium]|nr:MAG: hypothetical protein KatS3mg051_1025 [Anaerolineae bacterium]
MTGQEHYAQALQAIQAYLEHLDAAAESERHRSHYLERAETLRHEAMLWLMADIAGSLRRIARALEEGGEA